MVSKPKLVVRFEMFVRGEWQALTEAGEDCASKAATAKSRRRRTEQALTRRLAGRGSGPFGRVVYSQTSIRGGRGRSRIGRDTRCIEEDTSSAARGVNRALPSAFHS